MPEFHYWRCSRRGCGWIGTEDQKAAKPWIGDDGMIIGDRMICPACGCESFHGGGSPQVPVRRRHTGRFHIGNLDAAALRALIRMVRTSRWQVNCMGLNESKLVQDGGTAVFKAIASAEGRFAKDLKPLEPEEP